MHVFHFCVLFSGGRDFAGTSGPGTSEEKQRGLRYTTMHVGISAELRGGALEQYSTSLNWLFFKGLRYASLSRAGVNGKPYELLFVFNSPLRLQFFLPPPNFCSSFFPRAFDCGSTKRAIGTLRRMSGSQPSSVAVP